MQQDPTRLDQLTSLRFFAALAVLFSHLSFLRELDSPLKAIANTIFSQGYSGVAFFFILSGFILSHSYQTKLSQKTISRKKYFLLRVARIWPLHFLTALPFVAYAFFKQGAEAVPSILANISLIQSWIPLSKYHSSLNTVSWSLSDEMFFYASFILLAGLSTKTISRITLVWLFVILVFIVAALATGNGMWVENGEFKISYWLFYLNPITRLLDFLVGILIYRRYAKSENKTGSTASEVASVTILLAAMYLFSSYNLPDVLRSQIPYLPLMGYIIYSFAGGTGIVSNLLKKKYFVLLGEASFSLYLIHAPIITIAYTLYKKLGMTFSPILFALLLIVVCTVVAIFTYKRIELPLHQYLKSKINRLH